MNETELAKVLLTAFNFRTLNINFVKNEKKIETTLFDR